MNKGGTANIRPLLTVVGRGFFDVSGIAFSSY